MSKHDLKARPIFHQTKDAIQAHLTAVTAALAVARHLYRATGITAPKLIKKLIDLQENDITLPNGHTNHLHQHRPPHPRTTHPPGALKLHESGGHPEDLNMYDATFTVPDLTIFAGLDELGLVVTGHRVEPERAVLECREAEPEN